MISVDSADRGVLYWVIGILITVNLGLLGWSVVVLDGKADDAAVARIERQAEEIGRRDRDYLVRSQIEDLVRNGSPYVSDKPKIEDQLDKLETSVGAQRRGHSRPRRTRWCGSRPRWRRFGRRCSSSTASSTRSRRPSPAPARWHVGSEGGLGRALWYTGCIAAQAAAPKT